MSGGRRKEQQQQKIVYVEPCNDDDDDGDGAGGQCSKMREEEEAANERMADRDPNLRPIYEAFDENMVDARTRDVEYFMKTVPGKATLFSGKEAHLFPTGTFFSSTGKHAKSFRHFIFGKDGPSVFCLFEVFRNETSSSPSSASVPRKVRFESAKSFKEHCAAHAESTKLMVESLSHFDPDERYPTLQSHDDLSSWDAFLYPSVHPTVEPRRSAVFYVTKTSRIKRVGRKPRTKCYVCVRSTAGPLLEGALRNYAGKDNKRFDAREYVRISHSCSETALRNACRVAYLVCAACGLDGDFEKERPDASYEMPKEEEEEVYFTESIRCVPSFVQHYNTAAIHRSSSSSSVAPEEEEGTIVVASFNGTGNASETSLYNAGKIMVYIVSTGEYVSVPVDALSSRVVSLYAESYASMEELEAHRGHLHAMHATQEEMDRYAKSVEAMETLKSTGYGSKYLAAACGVDRGTTSSSPHQLQQQRQQEEEEEGMDTFPLHAKVYEPYPL